MDIAILALIIFAIAAMPVLLAELGRIAAMSLDGRGLWMRGLIIVARVLFVAELLVVAGLLVWCIARFGFGYSEIWAPDQWPRHRDS